MSSNGWCEHAPDHRTPRVAGAAARSASISRLHGARARRGPARPSCRLSARHPEALEHARGAVDVGGRVAGCDLGKSAVKLLVGRLTGGVLTIDAAQSITAPCASPLRPERAVMSIRCCCRRSAAVRRPLPSTCSGPHRGLPPIPRWRATATAAPRATSAHDVDVGERDDPDRVALIVDHRHPPDLVLAHRTLDAIDLVALPAREHRLRHDARNRDGPQRRTLRARGDAHVAVGDRPCDVTLIITGPLLTVRRRPLVGGSGAARRARGCRESCRTSRSAGPGSRSSLKHSSRGSHRPSFHAVEQAARHVQRCASSRTMHELRAEQRSAQRLRASVMISRGMSLVRASHMSIKSYASLATTACPILPAVRRLPHDRKPTP